MPIYEYICEADGTTIELLRPMADADKPVPDPEGRGRRFVRKHSTFAAKSGSAPAGGRAASALPLASGCCPCGKRQGSCGQG
jgi:putative FmdB family regulatory protein